MHLKMVWYSETTTWVRSQVGFGEDDAGTPYFIIRNSWSADWGEGGYVRVKAGGDPTAGHCGMCPYNGGYFSLPRHLFLRTVTEPEDTENLASRPRARSGREVSLLLGRSQEQWTRYLRFRFAETTAESSLEWLTNESGRVQVSRCWARGR
jgi:hypothetical protein